MAINLQRQVSPNTRMDFMMALMRETRMNILDFTRIVRRKLPSKDVLFDKPKKTIIVTGGSKGFGQVISQDAALRGARVIIAARNMESSESAIQQIKKDHPTVDVVAYKLDLSSFQSIRSFAQTINEKEERVDILVNNAAIVSGNERKVTYDGIEESMQVNYFGLVLLTSLLTDKLIASKGRIVNVNSMLHFNGKYIDFNNLKMEKEYNNFDAYADSKLALMMYTRYTAKKLHPKGIDSYTVDPGWSLQTGLANNLGPLFRNIWVLMALQASARTVESGANSVIFSVIYSKEDYSPGSPYQSDGIPMKMSTESGNEEEMERLMTNTFRILGIDDPNL